MWPFKLCPRINAAGRMDSALRALELLLAEDEETAAARARQLCDDTPCGKSWNIKS